MIKCPAPQAGEWFVVFPDDRSAEAAYRVVRPITTREIAHPSGRPWILGCWPEGTAAVGALGGTKIVAIGQHRVTSAELMAAAGRAQTVTDIDSLSGSVAGSMHLAVSVNGNVRVQGTITGVRRIYVARIAGVNIASDRADVLAFLTGAALDEGRLALHLLEAPILYPLAGQPVWEGVELVPTDEYLVLTRTGRYSRRRWVAPEPITPLSEGASRLREALTQAVDARVGSRPLVSCDLGGLDSTAVCSVVAGRVPLVVAYTAATYDPGGDDVYWSKLTVSGLGNVEHHVIPADMMPASYHGLLTHRYAFDEPCTAAVDLSRWRTIGELAAQRGSSLHFVGFGGDELLYGSLAHLHSMIRTKPKSAIGHLRGFAIKYRWRWKAVARQLFDNRPYGEWLRVVADNLTSVPEPFATPLLDWGFQPRFPPWIKPETVEMARAQILAEAGVAEPLSTRRGTHRELETMRFLSRLVRQYEQLAAGLGLTFAAPYYDDRVIEAGLSVCPEERITPWRYKPLILEAMRGVVPAESLSRQTKANADCEEEVGLREHRGDLLTLWHDCRLAEIGLVDVDELSKACSRPFSPILQTGIVSQTVACELWLRALETSTAPIQGGDRVEVA